MSGTAADGGGTGDVLRVEDLHIEFTTNAGAIPVVRGVSLSVARGETLVVLGESGCGKSVTARAIQGILHSPPASISRGSVLLDGIDLLGLPRRDLAKLQGDRIAMVFQDALAALNPVYTVGSQIAEMFRLHRRLSRAEAHREAVDLLARVGIPDPAERANDYPHQFSGGMRQRVMIAAAVALTPDVLLADEPTTALDVTVQAQIMQLLARLRRESGMALVLITHDVAVAAEVADRIAVMYAGRIVETASAVDLIERPAHPYSAALIALATDETGGVRPIGGTAPPMDRLPSGCAFHPRCPRARPDCSAQVPALQDVAPGRKSACLYAKEMLENA